MDKPVTLIAKTLLPYGGQNYAEGAQFVCDAKAAAELIKSGQASVAPAKVRVSSAEPARPAEIKAEPKP